jgi:hypothetical protein
MTYLDRNHPSSSDGGMELSLICLLDDIIHVCGFGREDTNILELDVVSQVDDVPCQG